MSNEALIETLIMSNVELKEVISSNESKAELRQSKTDAILDRLLEAMVRSEERRIADNKWQERVDHHQEKQDERIEEAQKTATEAKNQSLVNAKWVNLGVAILTGMAIFVGQKIISAYFGG